MSASKARRRPRSDIESDEDGDLVRRSQGSTPSESSKRARTNGYHSDRLSETPENETSRTNGYRNRQSDNSEDESEDQAGSGEFQPGAIVRVKLVNFVTYENAEFFPGPSMNMVIGPNGTGKSSLVCALCLGLGWGTGNLGRAKEFAEYVKHDTDQAFIEIELCKRPNESDNHVVRLRILKDGSKRDWWLNGKKTSLNAVQKLVKDFSIQIDNLCQFLPQEKVSEFAGLSPVDLLHETQRAAAPPEMLEMHDSLKELRKSQKALDIQQAGDRELLGTLEKRQQNLQAEVQKLQERKQIEGKISHLQLTIPFVEYRAARAEHKVRSQAKKEAQRRLRDLEAQVQPTMEQINAKQIYLRQIAAVVSERTKALEGAEREADAKVRSIDAMDEDIKKHEAAIGAQHTVKSKQRAAVAKAQKVLTDLKSKLHDEPIVFEASEWNDKIRAKEHEGQDIKAEIEDLSSRNEDLKQQGKEVRRKIEEAKRALAAFDTQEGQQLNKLERASNDTARAWKWVQENRDQFRQEIYGPPLITCSLKDPRYANTVEALLSRNDFLTFTTQNLDDFKKLSDQLSGTMGLKEITIRDTDGALSDYRILSDQQMQQVGLDAWAIDFIDGPGPVLSMLCARGLDSSAVALQDTSTENYNRIKDHTKLSRWATKASVYQVHRREEYGPEAVSTTSSQVQSARFWTDQPVDTSAKRRIQENIDSLDSEYEELKRQVLPLRVEMEKKREKIPDLKREIDELRRQKGELQAAFNDQRNLPGKIEREEQALEAKVAVFDDIRSAMAKINVQHDHTILRKFKLAIEYKELVSKIRNCHDALLEAKIMAIEAESDVAGLEERNTDIVSQLRETRNRMQEATTQLQEFKAIAARAMEAVRDIQEDPANVQYIEGWQNLPPDLTVDQLEADIAAERTKLQFTHASNPHAIRDFEKRQIDVVKLKQKIDDTEEKLEKAGRKITRIRENWEPRLDELIAEISEAFSHNFEQIGCAGEVGVHKDEDFDLWAIQIKVKFRENETLQILDAHRQSGGERSVSTIFYLMSLQSLAQAPFRVVDEINQGMDPRNERMVHERMVEIACKEHTSQYFLITPKLLTGLRYDRRMKVLCIASGAWMPTDYKKLDMGKILGVKRALKAAVAAV